MTVKKVYLLSKADSFKLEKLPGFYDEERKISVILVDGKKQVVVTMEGAPPTRTKTFAYPSDDDQDPEDESCY